MTDHWTRCPVKDRDGLAAGVVVIEFGGELHRIEMCLEHAVMAHRQGLAWPKA